MDKAYIAIDLKSFYASVECVERGLDPLTTNLVVADKSRTDKTICLAVSPSLKSYGIPGRPRLFEVVRSVKEVNARRLRHAPGQVFTGSSYDNEELKATPSLSLDYIVATPQMQHYIDCSAIIYGVYLKYVAPEDIHVYSIDEVFMDVTAYLKTYKLTARELAIKIILDVLKTTGITATAGVGTNLFLAKVAMDIVAKRIPADENGVRVAELDELQYRRSLWIHRPLTDFWRVGRGYARKLERYGINTMGDIARCSVHNEDLLYRLFGVNAELLIDHAWGWEPCTIAEIKAYKPSANSLGSGQVLHQPYDYDDAKRTVKEMAEVLSRDLVSKELVADQLVLTVGYDIENLTDSKRKASYRGEITTDHYGRQVPKHAHGTENLGRHTSSKRLLMEAAASLFDRIVDKGLLIRRINITATHVIGEDAAANNMACEQLDLFTDWTKRAAESLALEREKKLQKAILSMQDKYGNSAVFLGINLEEDATTLMRNRQIGGHRA